MIGRLLSAPFVQTPFFPLWPKQQDSHLEGRTHFEPCWYKQRVKGNHTVHCFDLNIRNRVGDSKDV